MFNIELHELNSQPVLSIRKRTTIEELSKLIGESYGKIVSYLKEINEEPADAPFTAYFNLDMNDLDVEMGFWEKADNGKTVMRIATSWGTAAAAVNYLIESL